MTIKTIYLYQNGEQVIQTLNIMELPLIRELRRLIADENKILVSESDPYEATVIDVEIQNIDKWTEVDMPEPIEPEGEI